jgi:septal ring factor EnvC (AmiA/AmiB activator)
MFPNDSENHSDNTPRAHTGVLWVLIPGLALALAGNIYQFSRSAHLASDMAANERNTQLEIRKLADSTGASQRLDQQRFDELKDQLNTSAAATLRQARSEVKRSSSKLTQNLSQAHQDVIDQLSGLKQDTSAKLDDTSAKLDDTSAKLDDTSAKLDDTSAKLNQVAGDLDKTGSEVKQVTGDLGVVSGQVATNAKELAALREMGERNYFEFDLSKPNKPQKVGDIRLVLKKSDPKHNRYTLRVLADDKTVEKRDKTINEPVQLYVSGSRQPYEIVVNEIKKHEVVGYLATPKVQLSSMHLSQ